MALGQGQVDYAAFLQRLAEIGYDGPVILEVNTEADLQQSVERLKAIL
jgi:sugar phosphate isomerase/epimerase